jgi:hypothetical protein
MISTKKTCYFDVTHKILMGWKAKLVSKWIQISLYPTSVFLSMAASISSDVQFVHRHIYSKTTMLFWNQDTFPFAICASRSKMDGLLLASAAGRLANSALIPFYMGSITIRVKILQQHKNMI